MLNLFRVMFLALPVGLIVMEASGVSQKPQAGSVHGVVVCDPFGVTEPGVAVTLTDDSGKYQETAITDLSGIYNFSAPPGAYTLTLRPPKPLLGERISPVVVTAGLITNPVTRVEINPNADKFSPGPTMADEVLPSITQLELLHGISVPTPPHADKNVRASFSLRIHMVDSERMVVAGGKVKLSITMRNITSSQILFDVGTSVPQMAGVLPMVSDARGQPVRLTEQGKHYFYDQSNFYAFASDLLAPLGPGKTVTWEMELDKLFDITHPGQYKIQAVRRDPTINTVVKSNFLKLKLTP